MSVEHVPCFVNAVPPGAKLIAHRPDSDESLSLYESQGRHFFHVRWHHCTGDSGEYVETISAEGAIEWLVARLKLDEAL